MIEAFVVLSVMGLTLYIIALRKNDGSHIRCFSTAWKMLYNVTPLLLIAFAIAGLMQVTIPNEAISLWLGEEAGWKGLFIGPAVGALVQGGPFTFFPLFSAVFKQSVSTGTAIAMITGWGMINVGHLPYEFSFLGPRFVLLKMSICIFIPPLTGFLAQVIFG